tara:strand:- start:1818 stop:2003 length:186 start_codon:yes stop_codon:yes gene_type:complete
MGDNKEVEKDIIECPVCEHHTLPKLVKGTSNYYTCSSCKCLLRIEKEITFDADMDLDPTYH